MKKKEKIIYKDVELDSYEELYAYYFFEELKEKGYVEEIKAQPSSFHLSERVTNCYSEELKSGKKKFKEEVLLNGHVYTADFKVIWTEKALGVFFDQINKGGKMKVGAKMNLFVAKDILGEYISYFEVKPSYDQNNMTRLAMINIKWVWDSHKIFINLFTPENVFPLFFTPKKYLFTNKSGAKRKIKYSNVVLLNEKYGDD